MKIPSFPWVSEEKYCCCPRPLGNVILLATSFMILFLAYNSIQVLITTVIGDFGFVVLMVNYSGFAVFSLFTAVIVEKLGFKLSLMIGTFTYLLMIACLIYPINELLVVVAFINGCGGALTWASQGALLVNLSDKNSLGTYQGIFWSIYMINSVVGNGGSGVLLKSGISTTVLFSIFGVIAVCGVASLILLSPPVNIKSDMAPLPLGARLKRSLKVFTYRDVLLLVPLFIFNGVAVEFWYGSFPPRIALYSRDTIGFAMACWGGTNMIFSILGGRISDKIGRFWTMMVMGGLHGAGFLMSAFTDPSIPWLYYMVYATMCASCALLNTQISAVVGFLFPDQLAAVFSAKMVAQALVTATLFLVGKYVSFLTIVLLASGELVIAMICFIILSRVSRLDAVASTAKEGHLSSVSVNMVSEDTEHLVIGDYDKVQEEVEEGSSETHYHDSSSALYEPKVVIIEQQAIVEPLHA